LQTEIQDISNAVEAKLEYEELKKEPEENEVRMKEIKNKYSYIDNVSLSLLEEKKANAEDKLNNLTDNYEDKLDSMLSVYKEKVREKDKKTRESLEFIDRIGLAILPQSTFNQLITELQM